MKRHRLIFACIIALLVVTAVVLGACVKDEPTGNGEKKIVSLSASVPDKDFVIGQINYADITLNIFYSNNTTESVALTEDMIFEADKALLSKEGMRQIRVVYNGYTTKISLNLVTASENHYKVTITGGYVSAVNGKEIVSPSIPDDGESFVASYLEGTVLTVHWVDVAGRFFDYWTLNDIKISENSIIDVTVTEEARYHAYTSAVSNTVSFVPGFDGLNVKSKITDVLNEADIDEIAMDGYVFIGWTTDEISREQAHSAYDKNLIKFPYTVTRDTVLYGVWTSIGITYTEKNDGYAIVGFNGNVTDLVIPETYEGKPIIEIRKGAFATDNGKKLVSLIIPSSVEIIADGAFSDCKHLERVEVAGGSDYFVSVDGVLYSSDKRTLVCYPSGRTEGIYAVEEETETVSAYAFYGAAVGGITLGSGIKKIGNRAFYGKYVSYVDFYFVNPANLTTGEELFHENLSAVRVNSVRKEAFCTKSEFGKVSDKIITDEDEPTEVGIFETIESDGNISKTVYRVIKNENFENSGETVEILAVDRAVKNYTLQIRIGDYYVSSIAKGAFSDCDNLTTFRIPLGSRLERICDGAFDGTPWKKTLANDAIVANYVFYKYLGNAERVKIERGVEKIAEGAFSGNSDLKYIDITENASLTTIAAYAFYNCDSFKGFIYSSEAENDTLYLKSAVKDIGAYAFYNTEIKKIVLQTESAVTASAWESIGEYAFGSCDKLSSAQLSSAMRNIAPSAFVGCYALEKFVLATANTKYKVYDGILYEADGADYVLRIYPAGRLDAEFDPTSVRNYVTAIKRDENNYFTSEEIGTVAFNGVSRTLYMSVNGLDKSRLNRGSDGFITDRDGNRLTETTEGEFVEGTFVPNGQKYYYVFDESGARTVLFYDKENDNYYYDVNLSVTAFGEYSLCYSNIAALKVSANVREIEERAINIPGLVYIAFETTPVSDYSRIFQEYEPKYVVMSDAAVSLGNKKKFYGNNDALMGAKDKNEVPVEFFYAYDETTDAYDKTVLYSYNGAATGTVKTAIARTSRSVSEISVPESVARKDGTIITEKKIINSYAFFGAKIKTVYLKKIEEIEADAFCMAYGLTTLDLNSDFISVVGENAFGNLFGNGLFIRDYINGTDLYKAAEGWELEFFTYVSSDGAEYFASKYLIKDERGAFAVIVYENEDGTQTIDVLYGTISTDEVSELQESITKKGYDIAAWEDENGRAISADADYVIPYNQVLTCKFEPQTYTVYLYASPSLGFDFEEISQDASGLKKYRAEVIFDAEYSFAPTVNSDGKNVFWRTESGERILPSGIWTSVCDGEIELWADFGYKINFDFDGEDVGDFEPDTEYVFNGAEFDFGAPVSAGGKTFLGWALSEDGALVTDETGKGLSAWSETAKNEYTAYAKWE